MTALTEFLGAELENAPFSRKLRTIRLIRNLKQDELAEKAGLNAATINFLETGRNKKPQTQTVEKLAKALEVSPEALKDPSW